MRQLTQVEYQHLWGGLHRDAAKFAQFLTDYNLAVPQRRRIPFYKRRTGTLFAETVVMRESLPVYLQEELDLHETTLATPYVNGYSHGLRVIQGGKA